MHTAKMGDRVRVRYGWRHKANLLSKAEAIWEFTVGSEDVRPRLSTAVVGMSQGDRKKYMIPAREADIMGCPPRQERTLLKNVPQLAKLAPGSRFTIFDGKTRRRRGATLLAIDKNEVLFHFHQPLKSETVLLDVLMMTIDGSSQANGSRRQFDCGGEG
jgi:FKBP-type peptidyl-prolyl cis-trans isomerase 2